MRSLMNAVPSSVFRITTENQREKNVVHIVNSQVKSGLDAIKKKAQMVC